MDGFGRVLLGEWTKFRSVRSTSLCVLIAVALTVLLSLFAASVGSTDANTAPRFTDEAVFVHQPLAGDGTVTAHVVSLRRGHEWAKAGLMIKAGTAHGSAYAAIMVTPDHGIRLQSTFDTDIAGPSGGAPRWLRLTRSGTSVTGFESADGNTWRQVGTVNVGALPGIAEVGMFVTSPAAVRTTKANGGYNTGLSPTTSTAVFDNVAGTSLAPNGWVADELAPPALPGGEPAREPGQPAPEGPEPGTGLVQSGGSFTVTGTGDIAGYGIVSFQAPGDDDVVQRSLTGVQIGLMAIVALGVLFGTSEYKTGTIRTTFTASPRRGRVLAAKAIVVGGTVFVAGLIASLTAFLITQPALHANGYEPPAYPYPSLADGPVLRAVVGTALFLAVLALLSLAIGMIRRRTVGAIILVLVLIVVPQIVAPVLSLNAELWVYRLTPVAGLAIQRTRDRFDSAIAPWGGFAVLCAYLAIALAIAAWQLRKRDA